jgi:hypothetical protein
MMARDVWELYRDQWDDADQLQRKEMVEGLRECEDLWPAWLKEVVARHVEQWNAEVMGG